MSWLYLILELFTGDLMNSTKVIVKWRKFSMHQPKREWKRAMCYDSLVDYRMYDCTYMSAVLCFPITARALASRCLMHAPSGWLSFHSLRKW